VSEKNDYLKLKAHLPQRGDRLERIENLAGSGTPDVNFCSNGTECWVEMKSPQEPKRETSQLFGGRHKLSQAQMNWFLRQRNAKGKAYVLIITDKRMLLIDGQHADDINAMTVNQLCEIASWGATRPVRKAE